MAEPQGFEATVPVQRLLALVVIGDWFFDID